MSDIYTEFAILLLVSAVVGAIAVRMRQPLIVAFILVGILVGPAGLDLISTENEVHLLAEIGVTVLLFVVGLKLDMHLVRHLGPVALATGLGQLTFTIIFGYLIGLFLGMDWIQALYVAVALTFSSTIIIVKLLSDKREIDSLHGRIAMGFLIVQDIAVVVAMMVVGSLSATEGAEVDQAGLLILQILVKLMMAGVFITLMMRYVLPRIIDLLAKSQELMLVFAIAWGTSLAAAGEMMGFSKEVGAFLAGFSLASTTYREAINARLTSVRDFLLLFFFVHLGSQLELAALGAELIAAIIFAVFVLIGNPVIVMAIMGYMGYRRRTGFMAGLTVAQISEFSIIFVAMGISLGHVDDNTLGLITLVGIVTITLSTYMILYSHQLYERLSPWLGIFERKETFRESDNDHLSPRGVDVLVFGLGRYGGRLVRQLHRQGVRVLAVDFDPEVVNRTRNEGLTVQYGDMENPDFVDHLDLHELRWVISTIPDLKSNLALLEGLHQRGCEAEVAITVHNSKDARELNRADVDMILRPYRDAADFAAERITGSIYP